MSKLGIKILKLIIAIFLISMISLVLANVYIFNNAFSKLQVEVGNTASEAVNVIDGDKLEKIIKSKSMGTNEYNEIQASLIKFKNDENIRYIYTLVKGDDNSAYIAVDGSLVNPSAFGEKYDLEKEMVDAFNGNVSFTKKPYKDNYGTFISGYAPIKNSSGQIIAIVGTDADVGSYSYMLSKFIKTYILVSIFMIIVITLISIVFSNRISSNVNKIKIVLNKMSDGDLTIPLNIHSNDEIQTIAEYINNLRIKTSDIIHTVAESSTKVERQTENLFNVSYEITSSAETVAASIEEVSTATTTQSQEMVNLTDILNHLDIKIEETTHIMNALNSNVKGVDSKVRESNDVLRIFEKSVLDISDSFVDVGIKIQGLSKHLSKINEITNVINSIADQTNLLALNAAIEAARAGDVGRGFSIVAEEIRNLAEQSKSSSSNINLLLANIVNDNNIVIQTSDNMSDKLDYQKKIINMHIINFKEIVSHVETILPQIKNINDNIGIINNEKHEIISNVETTVTSSEEISMSSQELNESSKKVASSVDQLKTMAQDMTKCVNHFKI